ncbi:DUF4129 domain-containing protein [Actinomyces sp. ZJ308]|uniref:DUF4129 domain-containing protein n=1 Tax=Actinomyces sp. ZJ308 TaxID=2708342 RepID=UPI001FBB2F4A|nr:DUF4129 domain-containing protein [Actinomyces sp. ZJ308]
MRHAAGAAGALAAKAPATPDADEARRAARKELSRSVYHEQPSLWDRFWDWILDHLDTGSVVPGVPSWVSTAIVVIVGAVVIALLILLVTRISSARRVETPSLSVLTDDRDAAALTRAADEAAEQADFTTAVVERFRAIIRSLDERGIIDEYPGMTALEAATLTHQALGEHRVVPALYEAAHLFDAVLYGRVVPTGSQDQQMRELADQMTTVTRPTRHDRTVVEPVAAAPGAPA